MKVYVYQYPGGELRFFSNKSTNVERSAWKYLSTLDLDIHPEKKIKKEKWIAESMQTVDRIRGIKGTDVFYDIVQIQLLMASGREETATQIYNNIKKHIYGQ